MGMMKHDERFAPRISDMAISANEIFINSNILANDERVSEAKRDLLKALADNMLTVIKVIETL